MDLQFGIRLAFCSKNEVESERSVKKLNTYTNWNFNFFIIWQKRNIESIFKLKDKKHTTFTRHLQRHVFAFVTNIPWRESTQPGSPGQRAFRC